MTRHCCWRGVGACADCLFDLNECDECEAGRTGLCGPTYCDHGCPRAFAGDGVCDIACLNSTKCGFDHGDCDGCIAPEAIVSVADDDDGDPVLYGPNVQVQRANGLLLAHCGDL